ncbi:MAG TPA: class I SAM-dependent rRNA methyltransferase [Bryobacteraceae bacterium]|nr:class I SAM-dependent rRNA methyltransferase [Bryobacteraceae bacterium]
MTPVRISRKGANRIASGHPWVFAGDVLDAGAASGGDVVSVVDPRGRILGTAHYSSTSEIRLRFLSPRVEPVDREFFRKRILAAEAFRARTVENSDAYRLIYGEGDQLPGLVVDRYGDYLTMQALDQGMDRASADIVAVLEEVMRPRGILARNDAPVRRRESLPLETNVVSGEVPESVPIHMNGLRWAADLRHGQKTGVFLDQRENYLAVARHARGGRALDCFTSTGGFALHLAPHVESVEAVDSSAASLEIARANARSNAILNAEFKEADAFELLAGHAAARRKYSLVVLDPPAFAKSRKALEGAMRGYKEINLRALQLLEPGGILVTCSCSHHIGEADLLETIAAASLDAGRKLRVLERRTQSGDHPILLTVPETLYLKCFILEAIC